MEVNKTIYFTWKGKDNSVLVGEIEDGGLKALRRDYKIETSTLLQEIGM